MSRRKDEDEDELPPWVDRLWQALRDATVENLTVQEGELGGVPAYFVVAEGRTEAQDRAVALLLDKDLIAELEAALGSEEDGEEDEDEPSGRRYVP